MRIVVDIDGTICTLKKENESYREVIPLPGAIEALIELQQQGHQIILFTARNMKTCEGNLGKVLKNVGQITLEWLEKYQVPYDELYFGKPYGDIYIDDKAMSFRLWEETMNKLKEYKVTT